MRAARLVNLLLLLQTRGRMTADDLATALEVSVRSVYRDVDALSAAGVPIYAERGPGGGISLVDGYRTRLTGLTTQEAEALFLSGLPGPAAALGLGTVMTATRLKVLAALPPELRNRATRVSQRFHLDAPGWFQQADEVNHLEVLAAAVWDSRRLEIDYRRPGDEVVRRVIEPLGIVLKSGVWYLVARAGANIRTYRVSRVLAVRTLEHRFERPADFDLAAHWTESSGSYEREFQREIVTVTTTPEALAQVREILPGVVVRRWELTPGDDGSIRLRLSFDWLDEVIGALFQLGALVEVIDPPELRVRMVEMAQALLGRYGATPGEPIA